ncbi:MAG: signal peptidase II [Verrucomicrobiales bacterium]|nr:signal peptidase II [Verrucomicrobiales bacterium]
MKYFLWLSLPLYILDQVTKYLIVTNFVDPREAGYTPAMPVIEGFFNIVRVHNTGMAWGLLNNSPYANLLFGVIGITALIFIALLWRKGTFPNRVSKIAAALLVSGILGNFTDRVLPGRGYVVDFLDFKLPLYDKIAKNSGGHFPSFNVADSCICIAAFLLFVVAFRSAKEEEKPSGTES